MQRQKMPSCVDSMKDLKAVCEKEMQSGDFESLTDLGSIDEFDGEDIRQSDYKLMIFEGRLYLTECPTPEHEDLVANLCCDLSNCLRASQTDPAARIGSTTGPNCNGWRNLYSGCLRKRLDKIPDCHVGFFHPAMKHRAYRAPIVGEVAFKNETFTMLIQEGVGWVSPYTDVVYAILVKSILSKEDDKIIGVRIVVMKRCTELASITTPKPTSCIKFPYDAGIDALSFPTEKWHLLPSSVSVVFDKTYLSDDLQSGPAPSDLLVIRAQVLNHWYGVRMVKNDVVMNFLEMARNMLS